MPVTNADLLADDHLAQWLVENSPIKIPFYQAWMWQSVAGKSLQYARTTELSPPSNTTTCNQIAIQEPTISQTEFSFLEFATRYQLCSVDLDRFQYPTNLDAALYALAKRRILYAYADILDDPSSGLPAYVDPARVVDMSGGGLTLDCLDDAYERISAGTGRPTLIMSNSRSLRTYRKLCRDAGFKAERAPWRWYDPAKRQMVNGSVDAFNGTPWLANDFANYEQRPLEDRTYFMVVGDDGGPGPTRGVTGIVPSAVGRKLFVKRQVEAVLDDPGGAAPGLDTWVTTPAGISVGSQGALSIIQNYTVVANCGEGIDA